MSKNEIRRHIITTVIFAVFSIVSFVAPFTRNAIFWLAYLFGAIAIAAQIYIFRISFADGADVKSRFYGFPIARVGVIYMIVQVVLSLVEMGVSDRFETWVAVIINVLPLAFAVIGIVAADTMREVVEKQETKVVRETANMRALQSTAAALPALSPDPELKKTLETMAEEFRYSDPVSTEETKYPEIQLKQQLGELKEALTGNNTDAARILIVKVMDTLAERNRICKASK